MKSQTTGKKLANIVINDVLRHFKNNHCVPCDIDAEFLVELVTMIDMGMVSRNVLKDRNLWKNILEHRDRGTRSMLFCVLDSEHFVAREFFEQTVKCLIKQNH